MKIKIARGTRKNGYACSYGHNAGTAPNYPKYICKAKKKGYD